MLTKIQTVSKKIYIILKVFQDPRALGLLAFGVIAVLVTISGVKVAQDNYELAKKISVAKQRNEVATLENENLKLKNQYYETKQFLELSARRQFGRALPGETLYIVPKETALKNTKERPKETAGPKSEEGQKGSKIQQNINAWFEFLTE